MPRYGFPGGAPVERKGEGTRVFLSSIVCDSHGTVTLRLLATHQQRGESRPVLGRQAEQSGGERGHGVGLLRFRLAGATAGATGRQPSRKFLL